MMLCCASSTTFVAPKRKPTRMDCRFSFAALLTWIPLILIHQSHPYNVHSVFPQERPPPDRGDCPSSADGCHRIPLKCLVGILANETARRVGAHCRSAPPNLVVHSTFLGDVENVYNLVFFLTIALRNACSSSIAVVVRGSTAVDYVHVALDAARQHERVAILVDEDNVGFDDCGYKKGIELARRVFCRRRAEDCLGMFQHIFFINGSVRGPFVAPWVPHWTAPFLAVLSQSTRLAGATISCGDHVPHVQSFVLAMASSDVHYLGSALRCSQQVTKRMVIDEMEVGTSFRVMSDGYNIGSVVPHQNRVDWRSVARNPKDSPWCGYGSRLGTSGAWGLHALSPYETIFFKTGGGLPRKPGFNQAELQFVERITCVHALAVDS